MPTQHNSVEGKAPDKLSKKRRRPYPADAESGEGDEFDKMPGGVVVHGEEDKMLLPEGVECTRHVGRGKGAEEGAEEGLGWEIVAGHLEGEEHSAYWRAKTRADTAGHCC